MVLINHPTCKGNLSIIQAGAPTKHGIYFGFFNRELTSNVVKMSLRVFNQAHQLWSDAVLFAVFFLLLRLTTLKLKSCLREFEKHPNKWIVNERAIHYYLLPIHPFPIIFSPFTNIQTSFGDDLAAPERRSPNTENCSWAPLWTGLPAPLTIS